MTYHHWYGILFVNPPGSSQQVVEFGHPDNYYTYHTEQWNLDWHDVTGSDFDWIKQVVHFSHWRMYNAIYWSDVQIVANLLFAAVFGVFSGGLAAIASAILGIMAAVNLAIKIFYQLIVQSEQGDGWGYNHYNKVLHQLLISFGAWRDWGWYVGPWHP